MGEGDTSAAAQIYNIPQTAGKSKVSIKAILKVGFSKASLYLALMLAGASVAWFLRPHIEPVHKIQTYEAGKVSVSINENGELMLLDRVSGTPMLVDAKLTQAINNMLAAREYVKSNTMR